MDILLGCDNYTILITGEVIRGNPNEYVALATELCYVLTGSASSVVMAISLKGPMTIKNLELFWDIESLGIAEDHLQTNQTH